MPNDPFSANKQTQIGVEDTPGTPVAAGKLLPTLQITLDPTFNVLKYKGSGRRFASQIVPAGDEGVSGKVSGGVSFTELNYLASMIWGAGSISTPAGAVNARKRVWSVPLSGRVNPKAMTIEQGDTDDAERVSYAVLQDLGFDLSRSSSEVSGTLLARALEKAGSGSWTGMTATPTLLHNTPIIPRTFSAYMDDAPQGASTGTKLLRCFKSKFDYGGAYEGYYPMDAALTSFAGLADSDDVKATITLTLIKDAIGEDLWKHARAGQTKYIRIAAQGDAAENFKDIHLGTGTAEGGTFTVTYGGVTSGDINHDCTAQQLQGILDAMSSLGPGNTLVSGGPFDTTALRIDMVGSLLNDPISNVFTLGTNSLTGTGTPAPAFATPVLIPSTYQLDLAAKIVKPGGDADFQRTRVRDWEFDIVEDPSMNAGAGGAIVLTVVSSVTSL